MLINQTQNILNKIYFLFLILTLRKNDEAH